MLEITIPALELYDEEKGEFISQKEQKLQLEHSLVSLRKWESKWCKAFLSKTPKTDEETLDYIRCMTLTQHVDPQVYKYLTEENYAQINKYIAAPMTATTFSDKSQNGKRNRSIITAEIIYYWMIALGVPFECQKWHLNSLLTLIRVCDIKNSPSKKRSKGDVLAQQHALNQARRKQLNSKG